MMCSRRHHARARACAGGRLAARRRPGNQGDEHLHVAPMPQVGAAVGGRTRQGR